MAWRHALPGGGWSSPVVVGGLVIVTTAVQEGEDGPVGMQDGVSDRATMGMGAEPGGEVSFQVHALALETGAAVWDRELGKLLDALQERGLYDELTIVVTSDHGEEFNEHGGFWHGTTLYDEQVRVPLLVKLPQSRRGGTVVRHWVQSIDLMPTVLKLVEAPIPEGVQGGDLFTGTDVVYAEESHEGNVLESVRELDGTDEYKLITANRDNPRGLAPVELYRVDLDPEELKNLAQTSPDPVRMATKALLEQRGLAQRDAVVADSVELDEDVAAHLEAIGYIER